MKKLIMIAALLIVGAFNIYSQETYVGVQYQRSNPNVQEVNFRFDNETDSVGVNVSRTEKVFKNLGVTGEAAASFGNTGQLYTFLGGTTLKRGVGKTRPFVRVLGGLAVQRSRNELTSRNYRYDSGTAYALGAGIDYKVGKVSIRVLQADFLRTYLFNKGANNLRLGTGIVF